MAIEIPGVDQELAAEIAESIIGPNKIKLAKDFIDTYSLMQKEFVAANNVPPSNNESLDIFNNAKSKVKGGYEALCQLENMHNIVQFEIANF